MTPDKTEELVDTLDEAAELAPSSSQARLGRLAAAGGIGILGAIGTAAFGWMRAKGMAIAIGPDGLGVYGQLWSFVLYAGQVASLGIGVGATAVIAAERERDNTAEMGNAATLSLLVPGLAGAVVLALALAASPFLSDVLLDDADTYLVVLAALSIPFVAVQAPLQHVIQGLEDVVGQTVAYLIYGFFFAVMSVAGAFAWGVDGAVIALALGNVLLAALYLVRSEQLLRRMGTGIRVRFAGLVGLLRSPTGRLMMGVGAGSLGIALTYGAADLLVRTMLLRDHGDAVAGYWYALLLISVQFIGVLAAALSYLTVPLAARHGERQDRESVRGILEDSLRLVCIVALPLLAFISALRDPLVDLLFTSEFSPVADELPLQLWGDLFRSLAWTLGVALVPLGLVSAWVALGIGTSLAFGIAGGLLASSQGLEGAAASWAVAWGLTFLATAAVLARGRYWRPSVASSGGILAGAAGLALAGAFPGAVGVAAALACLVLAVAVATTGAERRSALQAIRGGRGRGA